MLYLIDSLVTVTGYGEMNVTIMEMDKEIIRGMLLFEDFQSFLHYRSLERLKKDIKILSLVNQDPLISVPNIKEHDQIIYYDNASDLFYLIEVLSPSKI